MQCKRTVFTGTRKRTYFTKRSTPLSLLPSPSWPTAASPRRRRQTRREHPLDIWQPAPRALPYAALLHYTEMVWQEGSRLTNWWITAPGAYTYNTRAWTRARVCRLGQLVRSFYMSPETRPFFSIVVVVKSSPSIQTHSRHFRPPPIRPRDYKDRNTMPFCFCVLIHCYCRVAVGRHRRHAPKTSENVSDSLLFAPFARFPQKSLVCFFVRILLYTFVILSNSFFPVF